MPINTIHPLISRALRRVDLMNNNISNSQGIADSLMTIAYVQTYLNWKILFKDEAESLMAREDNAFTHLAVLGYMVLAKADERAKIKVRT